MRLNQSHTADDNDWPHTVRIHTTATVSVLEMPSGFKNEDSGGTSAK